MEYIKDIPDLKERIVNIMEVYEYDASTTRKKNKNSNIIIWKIIRYIEKYYVPEVLIENGDILDWAIGNIDFSIYR